MLSGHPRGITSIGMDCDLEPADQENEIERLRQRIEEVTALCDSQNRMLASLTHDMRSPLGVILVASQMAALPNTSDEKRRRKLTLVEDSARQLQGMIQDIFDLSRLQLGEIEFTNMQFVLRDLLENLIEGQALLAKKKGIEMKLWIGPGCPTGVMGDPGRLRQVLQNLLTNAVKFTHSGTVSAEMEVLSSTSRDVELRFSIVDSGIGIEADALDKIFKPFQQAHQSVVRQYGGTGLGLSICRHMVEQMGGRIWVESQLGKGSSFRFTVRLKLAEESSATSEIDLTGLRVLVADEDSGSRARTEETLLGLKMVPVLADSGPQAVALLQEAAAHSAPFPMALFDLSLGGGDGFFVLEQIPPEVRAKTNIAVTTSLGQRGDAARCLELSLRAYLTHPVTEEELGQTARLCLSTPSDEVHQLGLITRHVLREQAAISG